MKFNFLLLGIVLLAGLMRLMQPMQRQLWIDEEQSVLEANGIRKELSFSTQHVFSNADVKAEKNFHNVIESVIERDSGNGVLYELLLSGWTESFGNSGMSVRMVSVIFSLLTVIAVFYLGRDLAGTDVAGCLSAFIFSIPSTPFCTPLL